MMPDILNSLCTPVVKAMDDSGVTIDRLVSQLADELKATEIKQFTHNGKIIEQREIPAWSIRQKARIDAHKLRGDYPASGINMNTSGEHTVRIIRFSEISED